MSAPDVVYYDMAPNPNTLGGRRRRTKFTQQPSPSPADMKEMGIGTRTCFAFRVPRTITTTDMSEGDVSHAHQHHPSDEIVAKQGLLRGQEVRRPWQNSPISHTTASLTETPISSPESGGNNRSSPMESLLSMPTPTDRSHQRRLQMERGRGNTYDGEQEPAGYRGQEATSVGLPSRSEMSFNAPVTTPLKVDSTRGGRRRRITYEGEMDPNAMAGHNDAIKNTVPTHLLAMPTPKDRSHQRRLQVERQRAGFRYEGEQEPTGRYRGQGSDVPRVVSPELSSTSPITHAQRPQISQSQHMKQRIEQRRPPEDLDEDPVEQHFVESDLIIDNVVRNSGPRNRSKRRSVDDDGKGEAQTGSPYLQFRPEGPTIKGFELSHQRNQTVAANSSLLSSENANVACDDRVHFMLTDLSPWSHEKGEGRPHIKSSKARSVRSVEKTEQIPMKPILRTPTRAKGYGTEATDSSSCLTPDPPARFGGERKLVDQLTPEREALAVLRSGSHEDNSDNSASTRSSENLRSMMGDLLTDETASAPVQTRSVRKQPDINEMALAAQNCVEQGEYDIAIVLLGKVLESCQKQYGDRHPVVASAYHNLGMVYAQRSDLLLEGTLQQTHVRQQALECFQRAARAARDSLGKNHPNVAVSLVKIGFLLLQARQFNPALVTFEEALRIRLTHYAANPHHPLVANIHNNIGVAHLHLQNFRESKNSLTRALNIQRHNLRVKRLKCTREDLRVRLLEVADTLANLGGLGLEWLRQEGGNEAIMWEAESNLAEALEIRSTVLGYQHPLSIQVKALHDIVRSSPAVMPNEMGSQFRSSYTSDQSKDVSQHTGSSSRAVFCPDEKVDFGGSRSEHATQSTIGSASSTRSAKKAQDAPAPKGDSSSLLLDLIAQTIAARKSKGTISPSRSRNHSSIGARSVALSASTPRSQDPSSLASEVPSDEDDSLLNDPPRRRKARTPEKTKIFVEPHFIPRQSPPRTSSSAVRSFHSDSNAHPAAGSGGSDSSFDRQSSSHAYDAEESFLISGGGHQVDLLSSFLFQRGEEDENLTNTSSHEIIVVRPTASVGGHDTWTGNSQRKALSPPQGVDKDFEEIDDGIAPLSQYGVDKIDRTVRLSKAMLETPERHLTNIHTVASRYLKKNRLQEAKLLFITILDCQRQIHGELNVDVGAALHNVGLVNLRLNEHSHALENFQLAVRVRKGALGSAHPDVAVSQVKVGITYMLMHEFDSALQAFFEALSIRKRALGALHPSLARVYNNIACVHVEFNELREARRAFEAALDIQRNALCHEPDSGPLAFGAATTLCNLGYLYRFRNMHQKAALLLKEAVELQEAVLGQRHPTVITTMDSLADALLSSGSSSQARLYYEEILSRLEYGENVSNMRHAKAAILYKMSQAHRRQNDLEAEIEKLDEALLAIQATDAHNYPERRRKDDLEKRILTDLREALGELKKIRLGRA